MRRKTEGLQAIKDRLCPDTREYIQVWKFEHGDQGTIHYINTIKRQVKQVITRGDPFINQGPVPAKRRDVVTYKGKQYWVRAPYLNEQLTRHIQLYGSFR